MRTPSFEMEDLVLRGTSSAARLLRAVIQLTAPLRGRTKKDYSFSMDTSVALIVVKTVSPSLRSIRFTEPVVIIEVTFPAAARMTISGTTLPETIFSIVPGKRFRMLVLMVVSGLIIARKSAWAGLSESRGSWRGFDRHRFHSRAVAPPTNLTNERPFEKHTGDCRR